MIYFAEANCSTERNFMRRKDGQKKLRARRSVAVFAYGFREHPHTQRIGNPLITGHAQTSEQVTCVSLFSGCGGLDLGMYGGFRVLGKTYCPLPFSILRAYDIDAKAVQTYNLNLGNHAVHADLTQISAEALPKASILLGGFPCQDFSSSGPKTGLAGVRGKLYKVMVGLTGLNFLDH